MALRFVEDRRTLVWAFVLFPSLPLLAYLEPSLLPWLAPLILYASYCSGVLSHNHNHCAVFVSKRANVAYGAWLSFFYGFPIFAWIPTHNQNHHRYLNAEGDATRTTRHAERDSLGAALTYPLASSRWQLPLVLRFARQALERRSVHAPRVVLETFVVVFGHAGMLALACWLHGAAVGFWVYAGAVGAPALLGSYWMMLTNYLQHVGCDPASEHDHSRNFVSPFWNWFVFENGLHTVHHQNPGLHWSRCRAVHDQAGSRTSPRLNQGSIFGYMLRAYVTGQGR